MKHRGTAALAWRSHRRRRRRTGTVLTLGAALAIAVAIASLMIGHTWYPLTDVIAVVLGDTVPGASFTVGQLRLPRTITGALAGFAFGAAGAVFQTMLRNPLASPDIIGVSAGAGAFAVIGIVTLSMNETAVSFFALAGALLTAASIYLLADRKGFTSGRFILIGIGIAAVMQSIISFVLSGAIAFEMHAAMQWLAGSLNGASWQRLPPLIVTCVLGITVLLFGARDLTTLRFGDETAVALGVRVRATRVMLIVTAVALLAVATATTGAIAFVAFMSGPIAARLVAAGANLTVPAGLVGSVLVLVADLSGQYLFGERYPVGVITGILGAPYLILLLIRMSRRESTR